MFQYNFQKNKDETINNLRSISRSHNHHRYFRFYISEAKSCLMAGSNLVFLVDGSNTTLSPEFAAVKTWLKKIVSSFKIEAIDK